MLAILNDDRIRSRRLQVARAFAFALVEPSGIEPEFADCQPTVLPLDDGPIGGHISAVARRGGPFPWHYSGVSSMGCHIPKLAPGVLPLDEPPHCFPVCERILDRRESVGVEPTFPSLVEIRRVELRFRHCERRVLPIGRYPQTTIEKRSNSSSSLWSYGESNPDL